MMIVAIRYCLEERYGDALIHLKTIAENIKCPKASRELKGVSDIIYYSGNMLPYILAQEAPLIQINRGGSLEFVTKDQILGEVVQAKRSLTRAMLYLMEDIGLDMPAFVESINKVRT
jgi:hypothetical protein